MSYDVIRDAVLTDAGGVGMDIVHNFRMGEGTMTTDTAELDAKLQAAVDEETARQGEVDRAIAGWSPSGDRIALDVVRVLERRAGLIVTPGQNSPHGDKVDRRGRLARVVAVGPEATTVAVGQRVYCSSFAGAVVEIDGHPLIVVSESELLLVEA